MSAPTTNLQRVPPQVGPTTPVLWAASFFTDILPSEIHQEGRFGLQPRVVSVRGHAISVARMHSAQAGRLTPPRPAHQGRVDQGGAGLTAVKR